jgi:hypothetical protein
LHLLAQAFEPLQSLIDVGLLRGSTDLYLELIDCGTERLLTVLDRAF